MSEPFDSTVLSNPCEAGAVSNIGINGTWDGSETNNPGKVNNGIYSNNAANRLKFVNLPSAIINDWTNFVASVWIKPTGYSIVNGVPDDGNSHYFLSYYEDANNRLRWGFEVSVGHKLTMDAKILGVNYVHRNMQFNVADGNLKALIVVINNAGIEGGADKFRVYESDGIAAASLIYSSVANGYNTFSATEDLVLLVQKTVGPVFVTPLNGLLDIVKLNNDSDVYQDVIDNINNEGFPAPTPPDIVPVIYSKKQPQVLILNSQIDLYALGYVLDLENIIEQKTFRRDTIITNNITMTLHNIDHQYNPDNDDSIFT